MNPYVFQDGGEDISNDIMGCNSFSTMGTIKDDDSLLDLGLITNAMSHTKNLKMGRSNLVHNA